MNGARKHYKCIVFTKFNHWHFSIRDNKFDSEQQLTKYLNKDHLASCMIISFNSITVDYFLIIKFKSLLRYTYGTKTDRCAERSRKINCPDQKLFLLTWKVVLDVKRYFSIMSAFWKAQFSVHAWKKILGNAFT